MPPKQRPRSSINPAKEEEPVEPKAVHSVCDVPFIKEVLEALNAGDVEGSTRRISIAKEVHATDYEVNLRGALTVGWWLEHFVMGRDRGWSSEKLSKYLQDMQQLYLLINSAADLCEMKLKLKTMLTRYSNDNDAATSFSTDDIACIAEAITSGVFQHYQLFQEVFTTPQADPEECSVSVMVEQPAVPQALNFSVKEELAEARVEAKQAAYREQVAALRKQEQSEVEEAQRKKEEEELAARKIAERQEEERAMQLELPESAAQESFKALQTDVRATLKQRQEALLARLAALETPPE
eukprot:TRINITY_DN4353_c6_g1_i1.p1 TRINITY_DN4353_c6_g1~~TRINITY_DN4353_c6_g1_i1.p1  ORF type:complete len:316 (+),score=93.38 TRINITY_DN4353_c6_g1_i1:61-948(+)